MTRTDAFLEAILERPGDEVPRLVYADWLEEQGDPRGGLLRDHCLLAQLPPRDPQRKLLLRRQRKRLRRFSDTWFGPLNRLLGAGRPWHSFYPACLLFLHADPNAAVEEDAFFHGDSVWRGELRHDGFRFPTTLTVLRRRGNTLTGRLDEDFSSRLGPGVRGAFSFEGAVLGRRLAFVTDRLDGPVSTPGLYQAERDGKHLPGTWRVPRYGQQDTFTLKWAGRAV
jgi:uncharacterized protein (TIGR02996 family)